MEEIEEVAIRVAGDKEGEGSDDPSSRIEEHRIEEIFWSAWSAKRYVQERRNPFDTWTRREVVNDFPPVIKEISRCYEEVQYWWWCFTRGAVRILIVDHKPTRRERREINKKLNELIEIARREYNKEWGQ